LGDERVDGWDVRINMGNNQSINQNGLSEPREETVDCSKLTEVYKYYDNSLLDTSRDEAVSTHINVKSNSKSFSFARTCNGASLIFAWLLLSYQHIYIIARIICNHRTLFCFA
jgi:hypothetical protein